MKLFTKNRTLSIAITVSVMAHAALLTVRFVAPEAFKFQPTDPGLEVILVNAKHDRAPLKADALAQANLDGGGNHAEGRAKSPLPDLRQSADGDSTKASRRKIEELERQQQQLLAQMQSKQNVRTQKTTDVEPVKELPQPRATDMLDSARALLRREAEIARSIEDYNKRPKKTQVTPSTQEVGYAAYYKALQTKIENIGTLNFPQKDGRKLYGQMVVYIPIFQDGTLYMKEGGPRIERSSGNPDLDAAALAIVRRAAPFPRFPENMRSTSRDDVWEIITRFNFTRDDSLQTETRGN
ncbi:TonB family protein [Oxalicibacterium faecigallinarum]|uniref:Membrane protein n=1 Tax=Oxalicibacterium faecigallinarum TaxID=573741 RepID=A0A8J3AR10_9BURK|nr:TonB family protein [Oxalicibacterium faecigallinarum]GGI20246.1 membrane protein [Oxalicibacterium faecigallinarum]